ncbi:MAG: histidinol-phosphatase HisJ family protein [Fastidiosipilaceae bacterium]|jgi:histidinol-phosphatase (PHP family)
MSPRMIDSHNHTMHFSIDGKQTLDELVANALEQGLRGVAVTEHYDKDVIDGFFQVGVSPVDSLPQPDEWVFNVEAYMNLLDEKKGQLAKSHPGFELLSGIELGYMPYLAEELDRLVEQYPFDIVIAAVHCVDYRDLFHYPRFYDDDKVTSYGRYLDVIIEMLKSQHNFDVLAHYDYVTRYAPYADPLLRYSDFPERFDEIFRLLITDGKSLEINTNTRHSMVQRGLADPGLPDEDIVRRYLELGGKMLTLSSDSHRGGGVGVYFDETIDWLKELGVSYLTTFRERQPIILSL